MDLPSSTAPLDPEQRERLKRLGLTPQMLASMERVREMQRKSGLSPEEFRAQLRARAERAQQRVEDMKQGWSLPVVAGFIAAIVAQEAWLKLTGQSSWTALLSAIGSSVIVITQFDRDLLPPRRRMIGGLLIGGALAGLLLLAFVLLQ